MTCQMHIESTHADCLDCMAQDWTPYVNFDCDDEAYDEPETQPAVDADEDGWFDDWAIEPARFFYGPLDPAVVSMVVIHSGTTGSDQFGRYFANPIMRNSDGSLQWRRVATQASTNHKREFVQHTKYTHGAPHCGYWNKTSIGIENPGPIHRDWPDWVGEMNALWIERNLEFYPNIKRICSHRHLSPKRKSDPGPLFKWGAIERLADRCGIEVFK